MEFEIERCDNSWMDLGEGCFLEMEGWIGHGGGVETGGIRENERAGDKR